MDTFYANREAWNEEVKRNNCWTRIVDEEKVSLARDGNPQIWVTPSSSVPLSWILPMKGKKVLNACGGGGQQTVILSAFGAHVTCLDISPSQLKQDRIGLERYSLDARLIEGTVTDLPFPKDEFDFILNPCSLNFVGDLESVFREFGRVLNVGGALILGSANPILYIFEEKKMEKKLKVKYTLPYSDEKSLSEKERMKMIEAKDTFEYSHTLDAIFAGLMRNGFIVDGFFSDDSGFTIVDSFIGDPYFAIKATKTRK